MLHYSSIAELALTCVVLVFVQYSTVIIILQVPLSLHRIQYKQKFVPFTTSD